MWIHYTTANRPLGDYAGGRAQPETESQLQSSLLPAMRVKRVRSLVFQGMTGFDPREGVASRKRTLSLSLAAFVFHQPNNQIDRSFLSRAIFLSSIRLRSGFANLSAFSALASSLLRSSGGMGSSCFTGVNRLPARSC